jgi:hypothetical protein
MYIIAKKKDYYDGVVGTMGVDKTLVYERETQEFEGDDIPVIFERKKGYWGISRTKTPFHQMNYHHIKKEFRNICDEHSYFIIGFCGKLYIGWKLYRVINSNDEVSTEFTYDNEYMKKILEDKSWDGILSDSIDYVQSFNALQIFRDLKSPAFVYDSDYGRTYYYKKRNNNHHSKFIINPLLKNYEFFKMFDSFQAFQEVSMFMGGVLGKGEKEITEVADKYKITQHGFNKWSFRKEPEIKK